MSQTPSQMLPLGTEAPQFELPEPGKRKQISLHDEKGKNGTLILFICNHCPFVIHVIDIVVNIANEYQSQGIQFIAINSNDVEKYPADRPELMVEFAEKHQFPFPYLYDESQQVAKSYQAACTPDFFLFDAQLNLFYRGQLDDSRPKNEKPVNGKDLRTAIDALIQKKKAPQVQKPSIGCNIKWKNSG